MSQEALTPKGREPLWTREFILINLVSLFTFLSFNSLLPTVPILAKQLGGSDASVGMMFGIFSISAMLIRPLTGQALDYYGRKNILFMGMVSLTIFMLAYIWLPSLLLLLWLRFFHGFGWGLTTTATTTAASDIIPRTRFSEGIGYNSLAATISLAIGPALGLFLLHTYNFTILFLVAAFLLLIGTTLTLLIKYPTINRCVTRFTFLVKSALPASSVFFFLSMTFSAVLSFLPLYAAQEGISNIGPFFTLYALSMTLTRPFSGRLADQLGHHFIVIPGIMIVILAMLILFLAKTLPMFLLAAVVYGIGYGVLMPSLQSLAILSATPDNRGAANSTFFIGVDLGIGISSFIWGALAVIIGYSNLFLCTIIPCLLALALYIYNSRKIPCSQS